MSQTSLSVAKTKPKKTLETAFDFQINKSVLSY